MRKILKNEIGITLIALVITIIVLLILAGVTIATLTGENGILTRASDAKEQTEIVSVKEQAQLDIANWMAERLKNGEDTTLNDATIKNIIETANATNTDKYYKELQDNKIITPNGYEILYSELYSSEGDILKVGAYVKYEPEGEAYVSNYTIQNEYSGTESTQIAYQQNTKWRILNIYDDGYVDLISETALYLGNSENNTLPLYLCGANGYNNGIEILNNLCNSLYGNTSINAIARNVSLDDIKNKMDTNVWNWEDYSNDVAKYGDMIDYFNNKYYPTRWYQEITGNVDGKSTNGILGISENGTLISNTNEMYKIASDKITPTNNYWIKYNLNMSNFINPIYYELFINKDETNINAYWLSSRFTCMDNVDFVRWGVNRVGGGNLHGDFLYKSDNTANKRGYAIRPVVKLKSSFVELLSY